MEKRKIYLLHSHNTLHFALLCIVIIVMEAKYNQHTSRKANNNTLEKKIEFHAKVFFQTYSLKVECHHYVERRQEERKVYFIH